MHQLVRQHSQFIVATHSPILMAYPDAQILQLNDGAARPIQYEETEHFVVTREFLNDRQRMLHELLADD